MIWRKRNKKWYHIVQFIYYTVMWYFILIYCSMSSMSYQKKNIYSTSPLKSSMLRIFLSSGNHSGRSPVAELADNKTKSLRDVRSKCWFRFSVTWKENPLEHWSSHRPADSLSFPEVCLVEIHAWKRCQDPISFWVLLIVEYAARSNVLPTLHLLVQGPWHSCQLPLVAGSLQLPWPSFCRHLQTLYLLPKRLKWPKTILLDEPQMQNPPFSRLLRPCVESESSNVCLGRTTYFRPLPC